MKLATFKVMDVVTAASVKTAKGGCGCEVPPALSLPSFALMKWSQTSLGLELKKDVLRLELALSKRTSTGPDGSAFALRVWDRKPGNADVLKVLSSTHLPRFTLFLPLRWWRAAASAWRSCSEPSKTSPAT